VSLRHQLSAFHEVLRAQLADRRMRTRRLARASPSHRWAESGTVGRDPPRQDAIRALEAVTTFFENTETSSPVPMFASGPSGMIAKNFLRSGASR